MLAIDPNNLAIILYNCCNIVFIIMTQMYFPTMKLNKTIITLKNKINKNDIFDFDSTIMYTSHAP